MPRKKSNLNAQKEPPKSLVQAHIDSDLASLKDR